MEVLGAVASSIAVVQALAAGKHAVSLFQEIPDIQKDFDYLMKELNMIKSMAQAVSRMAPTALEQDLINTAARNLNEVTAELEALLRICSRESGPEGNKMNKARKRKWLVEKSDIKKLQQRMSQAKETLHFALNSSRVSNDIRFQAEMRQIMMNMQTMHTSSPSPPLQVPQLPEIIESPAPVQQLQDDHTPESDAVVMNNGHDSNLKHMNGSVQINSVVSTQRIPSDSACRFDLLDIWKNILTEVGLPRRVAIAAANRLRNNKLNDNESYLVQKVLSLSRDISEVATTKVHEAVFQCAGLQEALQEQPWAINTIDDTGDSPLYLATRRNQVRSMEFLISAGADVNQQSYNGLTPLMVAVWQQDVESVKLLLKSKSNVNLCNEEGTTALHWASMKVNPEVTSLLLAAGASVKHRNMYGDTPLYSLAGSTNTTHQDIEVAIEMLLAAGSDLEARNNLGITPFLLSIHHNKLEFTRGLVKSDCSVHVLNDYSQNVLHLAARFASLELLWYLSVLDLSSINPYQEDSFGDTPFDDLVRNSHATGEWDLGDSRRPSLAEQEAFVELYQGVRDQALQNDIQNLERVLGALQEQDIAVAREHLAMLIRKEKRWERENLVSWYRALDKRIQHAEWELATEDIEGHLLDLQEELATPVWEIPSKYGYLWEFDDGESVSEEVSESEDRSEKLYDSDQQVVHEDDAQAA
ncbi:ankyrin repeat-containing domain protein [Fusarium oxysporum Fo47]|uniref:ankyrin repeat-containing domain protein n=1 Tax=Fusarium oxysporum Fo47 TaxID=660027 RepID=UPI0028699480|nr:ankyrin repeat-containing domain protein [Fusarium oxysporum Fo47]QKD49001.2 ankyrin repeat-containing domain protein [Fusarium oxysporum Fo47]